MKQLIIAALFSHFYATQAIAARLIPADPAPATKASTAPTVAPASAPVAQTRPVVAAPAPALTPAPPPKIAAPASARSSGFYAGGQVGDSTLGALLGYQLSKMYSMEINFDYVDPVRTHTSTFEIFRVGASGLALFPIKFSEMGPMSIFIKVGYAFTQEIFTVKDPGIPSIFPPTTSVTTTNKTGVTGGAGFQVDLSTNNTARLGVNYVGGDRSVYLAAMYKF